MRSCRPLLEVRHRREMAAASFAAITEATVAPAFLAFGHDLKRPRLELVKDLLQPRDTLVEPGRCPPAADRLHALPRAEAKAEVSRATVPSRSGAIARSSTGGGCCRGRKSCKKVA